MQSELETAQYLIEQQLLQESADDYILAQILNSVQDNR